MVNLVLFKSTIILGTIQLLTMIALNSQNIFFNTNITFGILTSLINHGTTSNIAKWTDRCMMLIGIYVDIMIIETMYLPNIELLKFQEEFTLLLYISSNWKRDLYYYHYYPYICYYFLSLSILSFIISKYILYIFKNDESILISKIIMKSKLKQVYSRIIDTTNNNSYFLFQNDLLQLSLSCHITSHLLLTITHILMLHYYQYDVLYNNH